MATVVNPTDPIGIFDSGVGGLTVARRIMSELPGERIVYFGDTARAPYGVRNREEITRFSMQIMRFLTARPMKMVIIACNTICVTCYYELCQAFDVPIFEIVSPAAEDCMRYSTRDGLRVGVIATPATVQSGGYRFELMKRNPNAAVFQKPCPSMVVLAEKGAAESAAGALVCELYLRSIREEKIQSLILGCTHFPLYYGAIKSYMGEGVRIVDPAEASAVKVKKALAESRLLNACDPAGHEFYISGDPDTFRAVARKLLGENIDAEKVNIEKY